MLHRSIFKNKNEVLAQGGGVGKELQLLHLSAGVKWGGLQFDPPPLRSFFGSPKCPPETERGSKWKPIVDFGLPINDPALIRT